MCTDRELLEKIDKKLDHLIQLIGRDLLPAPPVGTEEDQALINLARIDPDRAVAAAKARAKALMRREREERRALRQNTSKTERTG
ncbi:hypothetical protein [Desulfurivibrio alkaliphilus]|uniref:Uncharacterized protein n=1 Tax=Desulfurivibrio alkaliphilus (strain DSM 19089 / UNIQEM U267 / AHT2) TaxID=589865 RepID=D6Z5J4_DESAT|nr:hypothetical protein [Desulfurivibrio alkaliphilus]ADH86731.1 conserved hypothetical protein [Desulfurivibrio alkaliphilus AHT 2]